MSADTSWLIHRPFFRPYRKPEIMPSPNSVRVFRTSPEHVELQIRGENKHLTASLPFDVAKQVAKALVEAAGGYSLTDLDGLMSD
jgi:hypothetical protein